MIAFRKVASLLLRPNHLNTARYYFSGDKWKDRDEAAEKVFISQQ